MVIKVVIFDMDGVLIDAKEWHYEALNRALRLFGCEINRYDHVATFDGLPTKEKLTILSKERFLPEKLHQFINEMKQRYTMEIIATRCKPRFNHQYALSKLQANGYRMAVASNSIRSTVNTMMERAELIEYFDILISNQDVSHPKPNPAMYNLAIEKMGVRPDECLIVEDNENGIRAARAANAHVMEISNVNDVTWANLEKMIAACDQKK